MSPTKPESSEAAPRLQTVTGPDLSQIVQAFGLQALMACGKVMNPLTRKFETDRRLAQYHISVLQILKEKTQGNLTDSESNLLDDALHQARMAYIDIKAGGSEAPPEGDSPPKATEEGPSGP